MTPKQTAEQKRLLDENATLRKLLQDALNAAVTLDARGYCDEWPAVRGRIAEVLREKA